MLTTETAYCHGSQGKRRLTKKTADGNAKEGSRSREVKVEGRSSNAVTKWFLGDLWENTLGEGRGTTHQQGV